MVLTVFTLRHTLAGAMCEAKQLRHQLFAKINSRVLESCHLIVRYPAVQQVPA